MKRSLKDLFGSTAERSSNRIATRKGAFPAQIEVLEGRQMLSTIPVWNSADSGPGTLRQAILDSNASPGQNTVNEIEFDFYPGTINFIELKSSLPVITAAVNINGYSQAGSHENTLANGDNAAISVGLYGEGAWTGLYIGASHVTVQGLGISNFQGDGIWVFGGEDHTVIQGNYIGHNGGDGIRVNSSNNIIGGELDLGHRNVIAGNKGYGVEFDSTFGVTPSGNYIGDNWIGQSSNGSADGNAMGGILLSGAFDTQIGGNANAFNGKVIAYNSGSGILMTGAGTAFTFVGGNDIHNNFGDGVDIFYGAHDSFVDGQQGWSNTIHNNTFDGVLMREGTENFVSKNSIFANSEGIWLMQGANQGIQQPWLTKAIAGPTSVTITGNFHGKPNTTYELDFYENPDLVYYRDEGMSYLGAVGVTTNAQGNANFVVQLLKSVKVGDTITAQLGGSEGYSQFSLPVVSVAAPKPKPKPTPHARAMDVLDNVGVGKPFHNRNPWKTSGVGLSSLQSRLTQIPVKRHSTPVQTLHVHSKVLDKSK
jgi:hypothetical protein